jgi:hypothetical protein
MEIFLVLICRVIHLMASFVHLVKLLQVVFLGAWIVHAWGLGVHIWSVFFHTLVVVSAIWPIFLSGFSWWVCGGIRIVVGLPLRLFLGLRRAPWEVWRQSVALNWVRVLVVGEGWHVSRWGYAVMTLVMVGSLALDITGFQVQILLKQNFLLLLKANNLLSSCSVFLN